MQTIKFVSISFLVSVAATAGCGTDVKSTASGVFPAEGFAGRSIRVEISGDQTSWGMGATVDMGAGITVNSVEVASPTDLFADITIDPAATVGKNDVTVSSGGKFTLKQAFEITAPITFQLQGDAAQGSLAFFTMNNLDVTNQFDTTSTMDQFGNTVYPNINFTAPAGVTFTPTTVSPFQMSGQITFDTTATGGAVTFASGTGQTVITTALPSTLDVMTRSPMAITGDINMNITTPFASSLYSLTPASQPSLLQLSATSSDPNAAPLVAILGPDGSWSDLFYFGFRQNFFGIVLDPSTSGVIRSTSAMDIVTMDFSGAAPVPFSMSAKTTAFTTGADSDPGNDLSTGAANSAGALPFLLDGANIASSSDQDWIKITVPANSTKSIHVLTVGNQSTDTAVEAFGPNNATTAVTFGTDSMGNAITKCDNGVQEDCLSDPVTTTGVAATFYVKISAGANYTPSDKDYSGAVWLE